MTVQKPKEGSPTEEASETAGFEKKEDTPTAAKPVGIGLRPGKGLHNRHHTGGY